MKSFLLSVLLSLSIAVSANAQSPQQFNYQGAARTGNGMPLSNRNISLKISILDGSNNGAVQYSEIQKVVTNSLGLYSVAIGGTSATSTVGKMTDVTWGNGQKFIKVEIDPNNGLDFNLAGTAQLLSVPYAMYAANFQPGPKGEKGEKGDSFKFSDFTTNQLTDLKGPKGDVGATGPQGLTGAQGLKGDKGDQGIQGLKGDKGDKGDQGTQGLTGAMGPQGLTGAQGLKGDKGDKGDQGIQGLTGAMGPQGLTGAQGLKGDKGDKGDQGIQGLTGAIGPQGLKGDKGDQGIQGLTGAMGPQGLIGAQGLKGDKGDQGIQGEKGDTGSQGPIGLTGAAGPQGPEGPSTGPASGDLKGNFPNPSVVKIQGVCVSSVMPNANQVMMFNGTDWMPSDLSLSATIPSGSNAKGFDLLGSGALTLKLTFADNVNPGIVSTSNQTFAGSKVFTDKLTLSNALPLQIPTGAGANKVLTSDASGNASWADVPVQIITGPQGETGPIGPQGPQGIQGAQGDKGDTGAQGPQGSQGEKGEVGATGAVGPQGPQGVQGDKGEVGATGPQGATGAVGPQGPQGVQGEKGETGAQGPQGDKGEVGATGPQGATGAVGPQGPQGVQGEKGEKGETGATGPQGATGAVGPQGPQGVQGEKGETGAQGPQGDKGEVGATGPQGATGAVGPQGPQGIQGETGPVGPSTGVASGDLSGNYPNPSVVKLQGRLVSDTAPTTNQILQYNGTSWEPKDLPSGALLGITVAGSAVSSSSSLGLLTFSIADASVSSAGFVTTGSQTFSGDKTFNGKVTLSNTSPLQIPTGAGANKVLTSDASGNATWAAIPVQTATGPASGDLSGTYPSPSVVKLQGRDVSNVAPTTNYILQWNGTQWVPAVMSVVTTVYPTIILNNTNNPATYTLGAADYFIILRPGFTGDIILPSAADNKGKMYVIKNVSGHGVNTSSYQNKLDNVVTSFGGGSSFTLLSDGTAWHQVTGI